MSLDAGVIAAALVMGVGATLTMDLWNLLLKRGFGIPSLNYCLLGRWVRHLLMGTFRHANIGAAPRQTHECTTGWVAHYSIGIAFALVFLALVSGGWIARPTLWPALLFGVGTVVFAFFLMQPSFGLGIASSKAANPTQARLKSVMTHTVFGAGLYLWGVGVGYLLSGPS